MAEQHTAEARVKVLLDPAAAREMHRLAEETRKAAAAEDALRKAQDARQRGRIDGERRMSQLGVGGGGTPGITSPRLEAIRRIERSIGEAAVRREMRSLGYTPGGTPLAQQPGVGQQLGQAALNRFGLGGVAGMGGVALGMGGASAAAGVFAGAIHTGYAMQAVNADPWLSDAQKNRQNAFNSLPIISPIARGARNFSRSEMWSVANENRYEEQYQNIKKRGTLDEATGPLRMERDNLRNTLGMRDAAAMNRGREYSDYTEPGRGSFARESVAEKIRYQEESVILPARKAQAKAIKERVVAENHLGDLQAQQERLVMEGAKLDRQMLDLKKKQVGGDSSTWTDDVRNAQERIFNQMDETQRKREANANLQQSLAEQIPQARQGVAEARSNSRRATMAVDEAELSNLRGREQTARGQAQRMGAMGPLGRQRGAMALSLLKQLGIENAPPELQSAAESVAPDEVRAMREKAFGNVKDRFGRISPEFRDNVKDITGAVNRGEEGLRQDRQRDTRQLEGDMGDAFEGAFKRIFDILQDRITRLEQRYERDNMRKANN